MIEKLKTNIIKGFQAIKGILRCKNPVYPALALMFIIICAQEVKIYNIKNKTPELVAMDVRKISNLIAREIQAREGISEDSLEDRKSFFTGIANESIKKFAKDSNFLIISRENIVSGDHKDVTNIVGNLLTDLYRISDK